MLFDGYEDDPERTAAVMQDGWFRTSDVGRLDDDGRLWVTGRLDDVIISGGVKVPGAAVADRLKTHPLIEDAVVLGVPDEEWGERVVAFVVHKEPITLAEVRELVDPREWAPRQLVVVEEIPLLPNGKPDRMKLEGLL